MYFTGQEVEELVNKLVITFPGAEMLLETIMPTLVKMSKKHDAVGKMNVRFRWRITSGREVEKFNPRIKLVNEWNLFDYHRDRWRWMGWVAAIPAFKKRFNDSIVHLKFV